MERTRCRKANRSWWLFQKFLPCKQRHPLFIWPHVHAYIHSFFILRRCIPIFLALCLYVHVCGYMHAYECKYPRRPREDIRSRGAAVTGVYEPAGMGSGNQIQVLCKASVLNHGAFTPTTLHTLFMWLATVTKASKTQELLLPSVGMASVTWLHGGVRYCQYGSPCI